MNDVLQSLDPWVLILIGGVLAALLIGLPLLLRLTVLRAQLEASYQIADARAADEETFKTQVQTLANEALHQNRESFLSMAGQTLQHQQVLAAKELEKRQEGIGALLRPLKESVDTYRKQNQIEQGALKQELATLAALGQDMNRQASALRQALSSGPKGAGAWGEQQLKNVMTKAGMAEHVDFDIQPQVTTGEGVRLRPDARINLAGGGSIVVDAKAPLEAFLRSYEQEGPQAAASLQEFTAALSRHVGDLGKKAYWDQFEATPEFVVLFLPSDSMLMTAFDNRPDLLEWALNQRVILASPSTLIALLTTVAHGWRQDSLTQNAKEIAVLGKDLYDSMAALGEHYDKLGGAIEKSAKAYNDMIGSVERRVMPRARKFRDLQLDPGMKSLSDPRELDALHIDRPRPDRDLKLVSNRDIVDQPGAAQGSREQETP